METETPGTEPVQPDETPETGNGEGGGEESGGEGGGQEQ